MKKLKIKDWFASHKPTKRRIIQLYAALLTNANLKGYGKGYIYQGKAKYACAPGLNCYSCPAASASCPLGALQNALYVSDTRIPYYIFGILLLFCIIFGRWICGFLCPFGFIQDLLYKIKTPKVKNSRITRLLSYLKYVILGLFVVVLPLSYISLGQPMPGFCKYICPSGTLLGAFGLLSHEVNSGNLESLGPLFTWKFCLLIAIIVGAIFIFRAFCRFICPLGAIYGLFNKISILGIKLDKPKCTNCGICTGACKMDIRHVGDHECISCGDCITACPTNAITYRGPKIFLAPNEVGGTPVGAKVKNVDPLDAPGTPLPKKTKIARFILAGVMALVLAGAWVYYNFIDKAPETTPPPKPNTQVEENNRKEGNQVGDICYDFDLNVYGSDETVSVEDYRGKVTIVNFWYIYCSSCVKELQTEFPLIKEEYGDQVEILAVHSNQEYNSDIPEFIEKSFPGADFTFCRDAEGEEYFHMLGGTQSWPVTLVLDENGVIVRYINGGTTYEELKDVIDGIFDQANNVPEGNQVGNVCYDFELDVYGSDETVSVQDYRGKVTLVNFWYIYCSSCVKELQTEFPLIKEEYGDQVEILAVHSNQEYNSDIPEFIEKSFPGADFTFCRDAEGEEYFHMLGGTQSWPVTLVLDENGVIVRYINGGTTFEELKEVIDQILE